MSALHFSSTREAKILRLKRKLVACSKRACVHSSLGGIKQILLLRDGILCTFMIFKYDESFSVKGSMKLLRRFALSSIIFHPFRSISEIKIFYYSSILWQFKVASHFVDLLFFMNEHFYDCTILPVDSRSLMSRAKVSIKDTQHLSPIVRLSHIF